MIKVNDKANDNYIENYNFFLIIKVNVNFNDK